jgi:hypothetical protein
MSNLCRRSLFVLVAAAAMLVFSGAAFADCFDQCDPYYSGCSDYCEECIIFGQDYCIQYGESTCGEHLAGCIADNCTPNWQETTRSNVGTYDGVSFSHCNHHRVDSVTVTDQNHCNTNSSYQSYSYCDDYIDDYKNNCCWPSCCSGYGENGTPLSCNGYHSCS